MQVSSPSRLSPPCSQAPLFICASGSPGQNTHLAHPGRDALRRQAAHLPPPLRQGRRIDRTPCCRRLWLDERCSGASVGGPAQRLCRCVQVWLGRGADVGQVQQAAKEGGCQALQWDVGRDLLGGQAWEMKSHTEGR